MIESSYTQRTTGAQDKDSDRYVYEVLERSTCIDGDSTGHNDSLVHGTLSVSRHGLIEYLGNLTRERIERL
jgi:hypothetical protein